VPDRHLSVIDLWLSSGALWAAVIVTKGPAMESELRRVVAALPGFVWTALPDGQIDFMNQRWSEYTGLEVGRSYGRGWQAATLFRTRLGRDARLAVSSPERSV